MGVVDGKTLSGETVQKSKSVNERGVPHSPPTPYAEQQEATARASSAPKAESRINQANKKSSACEQICQFKPRFLKQLNPQPQSSSQEEELLQ